MDVIAFYDKRADMEKAIHELKEDFGIDRITSNSFGANAADLGLKVLAFNLVVRHQRQALGWAVLQRAKSQRCVPQPFTVHETGASPGEGPRGVLRALPRRSSRAATFASRSAIR